MAARTQELRAYVLQEVDRHSADLASVVCARFGISRQAANRHLRVMVDKGWLRATGKGRSRRLYKAVVYRRFETQGLQEDLVYQDFVLPVVRDLKPNVLGILAYATTEMINNAIDHSGAGHVDVLVQRAADVVEIWVSDPGVGIFEKITKEKHLIDERQALLELAKGKLTTDPDRHTGEGIFFTSRLMDEFAIFSGSLTFTHTDGAKADYIFDSREDDEMSSPIKGTRVMMQLNAKTDRIAQRIFDEFAPPDAHTFAKTRIPVKLAVHEGADLVSRSQAKRLMARTDRFKDVVLDFEGVESVGQAFADEVFRVWKSQHPDVHVTHTNASPQIEGMIARALTELQRQRGSASSEG